MSSARKLKISVNTATKSAPKLTVKVNKLKTASSPIVTSLNSPQITLKSIKSQSGPYYSKKTNQIAIFPNLKYKIDFRYHTKKTNFLKPANEPSPIKSTKNRGFSMTEEDINEFQIILNNLSSN